MSGDEIDTILSIKNTSADTLATKANFTAKLHTMDRDKQESKILNFVKS